MLMAEIRTGTVTLVVLDVSLRNSRWQGRPVGGIEICQLIRAGSPATPVMLATAHAMRGDAEKLLAESGADDYVSKPIIDHEQFAARAIALMERGEKAA